MLIKLGSPIASSQANPILLNEADFPLVVVDTKKGDPDHRTGILPAIFTLQWNLMLNKPAVVRYFH